MLERDMEMAVANCPDLFIEPGLELIRRQVVINGRRPDILFQDGFSRHMLVEVQAGRLDESHVQRHFYYYFDYRAKYPSLHLRLLFLANRIVPQHKQFLDEHGYEFREIPENDFEHRREQCRLRSGAKPTATVEVAESPGVLSPSLHEVLFDIEKDRMTLSYKMLLLVFLAEMSDGRSAVAVRAIAEKFQEFFVERSLKGKPEENPNMVEAGALSGRAVSTWERTVVDQPLRYINPQLVTHDSRGVNWASRIRAVWSEQVRQEIRHAAFDRLIRYFDRNVPGGY